jgi:hypothetical protein
MIRLKPISHHQAELQEYKKNNILQLYLRFEISTYTSLKYVYRVRCRMPEKYKLEVYKMLNMTKHSKQVSTSQAIKYKFLWSGT